MTPTVGFTVSALVLAGTFLVAPIASMAAQGDCGQPVSNGGIPVAADCLVVLQSAVGSDDCNGEDLLCVCDVAGSGSVVATDSLICLQVATGISGLENLLCTMCEDPDPNGRASGELTVTMGPDIDTGWNGLGHNRTPIAGASFTAGIIRRCHAAGTICEDASDCPPGETCGLTCNFDDPGSPDCELFGPTHERRCLRELTVCDTNADCDVPSTCEHFFGPPLPLSADGTPTCTTSFFAEPTTGTASLSTGEVSLSIFLRSRVHLGAASEAPCPRCGTVDDNPFIGDVFTCDGPDLPEDGAPCTVHAVSDDFGGVSFDCPPPPGASVFGQGLAIIAHVGTGTVTAQATLPCAFPLSQAHPSGPAATCADDFSPCSSNADCLRCTDDLSPCATDNDCAGGTCGDAPEHPIACGVYCHCGFCDQDPNQPCFSNDDCDPGVVCAAGAGGSGPNPQTRNNACANLICGENTPEECCSEVGDCINEGVFGVTPQVGTCSLASFRPCSLDSECAVTGSGVCEFTPNSCFGGSISRTGIPNPLGSACAPDFTTACTTNADCGGERCREVAEPRLVSLLCIPPTTAEAVNGASGIPGPAAVSFTGRLLIRRGPVDAPEQSGPPAAGQCNDSCLLIP